MKTETIANQYDGPPSPSKRFKAGSPVSLDYADSDNAAEIDAGIRDTIRGVRMSILAMGIGLAKLKAKGLYTDLGCRSMNDYLESLCDDMQIDRSTAHNWLYIGEAFIKYRRELEKVEFTDEDGPTKLPYVDRALETHEKREVFKNIKGMSLRAFKEFSKGEAEVVQPSKIRVAGNRVYIGETPAVTLAEELDPKTRAYLTKIIVRAGEALEAGETLYVTGLYDTGELRRFERVAEKLKKEMRVNFTPKTGKRPV